MRSNIVIALSFVSISAFANEPIKRMSCSGKSISYTVTITSDFAPGSKILTNIALTQFQLNPDGTARLQSDEDAVYTDDIFDNTQSALRHFRNNDAILKSADGTQLILSLKKSTLTVLNSDGTVARTLSCK